MVYCIMPLIYGDFDDSYCWVYHWVLSAGTQFVARAARRRAAVRAMGYGKSWGASYGKARAFPRQLLVASGCCE